MSTQPPDLRATTPLEDALIGHARALAAFADAHHRIPDGWRYGTSSHLLLAQGRLFTPGPLPGEIGTLPDQFCFRNAATTARRHHLDYAEGLGAFLLGDTLWCLPHAWCARDGIAIDPTWDPGKGVAYLGITITDPAQMPADNRGLLDDYHRSKPLLQHGLAPTPRTAPGRPVTAPRQNPPATADRTGGMRALGQRRLQR